MLSPIQIIAIVIGVGVIASSFISVEKVKAFIAEKMKKSDAPAKAVNKTNDKKEAQVVKEIQEAGEWDVVDVVESWKMLRVMCDALDLEESVDKLDELFPTFTKKKEKSTVKVETVKPEGE